MYCQPAWVKREPSLRARSTKRAPWSINCPAPSALCPTSLFPMSSHVGSPTAGPCALTVRQRCAPCARSESTVGVAAAWHAFHSSFVSFSPHPSRMHTSTGRPRGMTACGFSSHSGATMPAKETLRRERRLLSAHFWFRVLGGRGAIFDLESLSSNARRRSTMKTRRRSQDAAAAGSPAESDKDAALAGFRVAWAALERTLPAYARVRMEGVDPAALPLTQAAWLAVGYPLKWGTTSFQVPAVVRMLQLTYRTVVTHTTQVASHFQAHSAALRALAACPHDPAHTLLLGLAGDCMWMRDSWSGWASPETQRLMDSCDAVREGARYLRRDNEFCRLSS